MKKAQRRKRPARIAYRNFLRYLLRKYGRLAVKTALSTATAGVSNAVFRGYRVYKAAKAIHKYKNNHILDTEAQKEEET